MMNNHQHIARHSNYLEKKEWVKQVNERENKSQRLQLINLNRVIGNDLSEEIPITEKISLANALLRFVYINKGSRVADLENIGRDLRVDEFHNCYIASHHFLENTTRDDKGNEKSTKTVKQVTKEWFTSEDRKQVDTQTFKAGDQLMVLDPEGKTALNLWNGFREHPEIKESEMSLASIFIDHCQLIFGGSTNKFIDWLAHIQQKPGELPHYGWISIATNTGLGRNWIASVLTRVFAGYVAPSFDLPLMLETGFNGGLSRKVLAIVDEIQEGGNGQWKHAQKLKTIVNQEFRTMNPKCAPMHTEYNACRWLVFSNHLNAIPLDETDRRFEVAIIEAQPQSQSYYSNLYSHLENPAFIASVANLLKTRNIQGFNPGARPELSESKKRMIEESKSESQKLAEEIVKFWPFDVIILDDIYEILTTTSADKSVRPICDQVGMISYPTSLRVFGNKHRCRIIRNHDKWISSSSGELRNEAEKRGCKSAKDVILDAIEKAGSIPI